MNEKYSDIIDLPHHVSAVRPHMSAIERAAQFSSFAALTGYEAAVRETARLTDTRIELDEYTKNALNEKLRVIDSHIDSHFYISVTYYLPDEKKDGGAYVTETGSVKKIDKHKRIIVMENGNEIPIEEIAEIESDVFAEF